MDRSKKAPPPRVKAKSASARRPSPAKVAATEKPAPKRVPAKTTAAAARKVTVRTPTSRKTAPPEAEVEAAREARAVAEGGPEPSAAWLSEVRALSQELDKLIEDASSHALPPSEEDASPSAPDLPVLEAEAEPEVLPSVPIPTASRMNLDTRDVRPVIPPAPESVFDTARELLTTDFYRRKWGRLAMRGRSEEVDDFGYDPAYDARLRPMLDFLYATYFRVETHGIENVPAEGRCVLVANHSGTLPLDGLMIKTAMKREHPSSRAVRWLTEDFIYHFPYLGSAMNRLGAVRACQENAARLLDQGELVAVFPEGVKGIGKLYSERYRLQRFGRGGFIKLCLRTRTPIVPVAVVGAEETNPMLGKVEHLARLLGLPYVPVTPTFPLLGPVGLLPAPTKWQIHFGEPVDLSAYGPEAAEDELLVGKLAERVRASIQSVLDRAVSTRKSVFFG